VRHTNRAVEVALRGLERVQSTHGVVLDLAKDAKNVGALVDIRRIKALDIIDKLDSTVKVGRHILGLKQVFLESGGNAGDALGFEL